MSEIKEMILPKIINAGVFDAERIYSDRKVTKKRKVSVFEIEIPIEDGGFSYIDDVAYPICNDCIICAKPGQIRYTVLPFKCYYVHMLLNEGPLFDYLANTPHIFRTIQKSKYIDLFTSMIAAYCSPFIGNDIFIQSKVLELIYRIHSETQRYNRQGTMAPNIGIEVISNALSFFDNNYHFKNTLDDVAKSVNLSPIYFHKVFSAAIGQTPYQYLLDKRLRVAKELLLFSDRSLTEIAFECGFTSQSYFNYVFKKEVGVTPRQYKKDAYDKYPD